MRLINADDLVKAFEALDQMSGQYAESFTNLAGNRSMEIECAKDYIDNAKTIDAVPVVHAHWNEDECGFYSCSNCGYEWDEAEYKTKYCPECGAKMERSRA